MFEMEARRVAALVSLALVGAVVVGLVATAGNGSESDGEALPEPAAEAEAQ